MICWEFVPGKPIEIDSIATTQLGFGCFSFLLDVKPQRLPLSLWHISTTLAIDRIDLRRCSSLLDVGELDLCNKGARRARMGTNEASTSVELMVDLYWL